ncbi:hypothetical protein PF008_g9087 [Phytophthora fragariae]|uniref:EF-hand domain-containing protein n=1 Tax=Phytophthora fragariae TaxID=53985 RepID=A0A6G0RXQ6_9STRA|nr:hypothetical protein PF008_g9087 [Phytophthora fragariae]
MTLDRRTDFGIKASRNVKGANVAAPNQFASIQERRVMKKVAQPEHAYTGCVPYTSEDDESDVVPKRKNPPILGYRGHLRHDEDRIGTTFTQGLAVATRSAEPALHLPSTKARPLNNQPRQVHFVENNNRPPKPSGPKAIGTSSRSRYGLFDNANGYEDFAAPPAAGGNKGMSPRSGYGAFDNASGYGAFGAPPARGNLSARSGYGEFENASGYGAFAAPPKGKMSPRSGYGAFDNASGYGAFGAPPAMSSRSGYGAFDNASGYGAFAAPPAMSPRSGYGAFDNASGYGAFAAPPADMSPRSGYGAFDNASGYGAFAAPPAQGGMSPRSVYGEFDNASGYGAFAAPPGGMSPRSGYGKFDDASGYGNFALPPDPVASSERQGEYNPPQGVHSHERRPQQRTINPTNKLKGADPVLQAKYQQAVIRIGGEQAALRLWTAAAQTVWQRYTKRTELLQAVKRSFEKHERMNHGFMTKVQLKEALRDLACVFTDDQITALFGIHDKHCTGAVAMGELLLALTDQL